MKPASAPAAGGARAHLRGDGRRGVRRDELGAPRAVEEAQLGRAAAGESAKLLRQKREHHGVPVRLSRRRVGSLPPEDALLAGSRAGRDPAARLVGRIDADLDPLDAGALDPDLRQRRCRVVAIPPPDAARAGPVADLERRLTGPGMEPGAAEDLGLVGRRRSRRRSRLRGEVAPEQAQQRHLRVERLGLVVRHGIQGPQMLEARVDRLLQEGRVPRLPAADHGAAATSIRYGMSSLIPGASTAEAYARRTPLVQRTLAWYALTDLD